jgi:lipid-A-disaccharide synthase-like uncharacterized protein
MQIPFATNAAGFFLSTFWCGIFWRYTDIEDKEQLAAALGATMFTAIGFVGMTFMTIEQDRFSQIIGMAAVIMNAIMYAAPLGVIGTVLKYQDSSCMPLALSVLGGLASLSWFVYGWARGDYFMMAPNGAGIILALIQLHIKHKYCVLMSNVEEEEDEDGEEDEREGSSSSSSSLWKGSRLLPSLLNSGDDRRTYGKY